MRYRSKVGGDIDVTIPLDQAGGRVEARVERAVRWLWSRGIYPGPAAVNLRVRGFVNNSRTLNGRDTKIRNRLLAELGIGRQRRDPRFT